ncbi:MAG: NAD(P)-dependent oxidoreductase [Oceanospirillaceae bacterium]|nr:NAD(P)-dependent oxidoreductase [Oceanospirillaceae bacterium]
MKKILVTGGFGFIGSYVTRELLSKGYKVLVADIIENQKIDGAEFVKCDIRSENDLKNVFEYEFDTVIHLAGFSNLREAKNNPSLTISLNTLATTQILELCVEKGILKFIYGSSAYANSSKGSFYSISKLASEKIVEEFHKKHKLNYNILRYGSVYSEMASDNNYVYNLIKNAFEKGEINHSSDGMELREYIHASDVSRLTLKVLENEDFINQSFILTGIEQFSRIQLFEMIKEISGEPIKIITANKKDENQYNLSPYSFQASRAKKLIANPQIDLGQGLLEIIRNLKLK